MGRRLVPVLAAATALFATAAGTPIDQVTAPLAGATDSVVDEVATAAGVCADLDPADCLLPFPNDRFTTPDPTTPTGLRVDLSPLAMPRNVAGIPIDPTEWNRNDGWSPGSMLLTRVAGLDLHTTFGTDRDVIEQPSLSLAPDAPIVVVDTETGDRHPYLAELDQHPETTDAEQLLIVRPLTNFLEGHRYVIGLRDLRDGEGALLPARPTFVAQRDAWLEAHRDDHPGKGPKDDKPGNGPKPGQGPDRGSDAPPDPVLDPLADAGVDIAELHSAWTFTIASGANLAGRALAIRDETFAALGDTDLADGVVTGAAPAFTVDEVQERTDPADATLRVVRGTLTVPNYLTHPEGIGTPELEVPDELDPGLPEDELAAQELPGSHFLYDTPTPGPMDTPIVNPVAPTLTADYVCSVPRSATAADPATPSLYGHGLLGGLAEPVGSSTEQMRRRNHLVCATEWTGMSEHDLANVAVMLADVSRFRSLTDRAQQGFLNFLVLGRALAHPAGMAAHPAFQDAAGAPLHDPSRLVYDGNSQGGIMGGALTALAPDFTRAVLGVPGMNYSTLLHRSVDWEGTIEDEIPVGYSTLLYTSYPDKQDQLLVMGLLQMLWDRAEGNGYAQHMTDDPYPNTPAHQVLLHVALGDYQVANLAAEVEARTIGARFLQTALAEGRHWADGTGERLFAFDGFDVGDDGSLVPHGGSAIVYWDSGNPVPPNGNIPPEDLDEDPHSDPRRDPHASDQKATFYRDGTVVDVHAGAPYFTSRCPRHDTFTLC